MKVSSNSTSCMSWRAGQQQRRRRRQVPVSEMVDSNRRQIPSEMYPVCLPPSSGDCCVTHREYVARSSTLVTPPCHSNTQLTPSSSGRSRPYQLPPATYKHLPAVCIESTSQRVNGRVDVRAKRAELPETDVTIRTPTHRHHRSLSLPMGK